MERAIVRIDWYTKFMLTVIAVLLLGILIKPSFIPERVQAEEKVDSFSLESTELGPLLMSGVKGLKATAMNEGSAERAEGDAEEWSYWFGLDSGFLEDFLSANEYYQEHPVGKRYLEHLVEKAQGVARGGFFQRPLHSFVIEKIGDRYFMYQIRNLQAQITNKWIPVQIENDSEDPVPTEIVNIPLVDILN